MSNIPFLHARDLVKSYGARRVLDGVSLAGSPGQRIGLVGENGAGKSTLLRMLAGVEEPDDGQVQRPADCGFLWQELPFPPGATVQDVLDDALAEIRATSARLDELTLALEERPDDSAVLAEYGDLLEWAQDHDMWDADRRAKLVLAGLGLSDVDNSRRLDTFSGGQRSRIALAALLIRQPRAMLLDEPTNHLDDEAVSFLERQLSGLPGTVVVASHDRVFLDEVCTDIVDLDPARGGVTRYGGAYTEYLEAKRLELVRWEQQYAQEQDELKELRVSVEVTAHQVNHQRSIKDNNKVGYDRHGGRVQKQISRRVRNAQQRLDELTRDQVRRPPAPLRFNGAMTGKVGAEQLALSLRDVRLAGRLDIGQLDVSTSSRLRILAGQLTPDAGDVHRARGVRVGLLEQDVVFSDLTRSARQLYSATGSTVSLSQLGLLAGRDLDRPVGELSIGQRRRVALALLIARPPEVLLLDEPTNHLSLSLAEELEDAVKAAPGAVVIASHDRWLRRNWEGPELALDAGRVA
jgi:macrolide transport system ATP-binding/permease protein